MGDRPGTGFGPPAPKAGREKEVIAHAFGTDYETVTGVYTAPADDNAWFVQGSLDFENETDVSYFSIKRVQTSETTDDFGVMLNDTPYAVTGTLSMVDHPLTWCHTFEGGRAWYTALGHPVELYANPLFTAHVLGGIRWAAGVAP